MEPLDILSSSAAEGIAPLMFVLIYFKFLGSMDQLFSYKFDPETNETRMFMHEQFILEDMAEMALFSARAAGNVHYDGLLYDPRSGSFSIEGLSFANDAITADIDGIRISAVSNTAPVTDIRVEFQGLHIDPASMELPRPVAMQLQMLGLDNINADGAVEISYNNQYSDASVSLNLDIEQLGHVAAKVDLGSLHLDPTRWRSSEKFTGEFLGASVAFENKGALQGALTMMMGTAKPEEAQVAPMTAMAGQQVTAFLNGADIVDNTAEPSETAARVGETVTQALTRFMLEQDRIAISLAPETAAELSDLMTLLDDVEHDLEARQLLLEAVNPVIQATAVAPQPIIVQLASEDTPVVVRAQALIDGLGAPRNINQAIALLEPVADEGDTKVLLTLAAAYQARGGEEDAASAYEAALQAEAAGSAKGGALASRLASELPLEQLLKVEQALFDESQADPALLTAARAGDSDAMRRLAQAYQRGDGVPRHILQAYGWALLAAAAGDRAGLQLRDSLEAQFAHADEDEQALWAEERAQVQEQVLEAWNSALGQEVAAQAQK